MRGGVRHGCLPELRRHLRRGRRHPFPTTMELSAADLGSLEPETGDGRLHFTTAPTALADVGVGTILVAGVGPSTPKGLLRASASASCARSHSRPPPPSLAPSRPVPSASTPCATSTTCCSTAIGGLEIADGERVRRRVRHRRVRSAARGVDVAAGQRPGRDPLRHPHVHAMVPDLCIAGLDVARRPGQRCLLHGTATHDRRAIRALRVRVADAFILDSLRRRNEPPGRDPARANLRRRGFPRHPAERRVQASGGEGDEETE